MIEIIGTELNQWDTGRSVRVTGTEASHVHLANQGDSKAVIMELADSLALIPNYLLQTGKQLCVYAVSDGVTIESKVFYVKKRERPENYVYEEDQRNFIYELITDAQEATNAANQVAQDLLEAKDRGDFNGPKGDPFVIINDARGEEITIDDAAKHTLVGMRIFGKTTQDGVPTPDAPVELLSVGDSGSIAVDVTGKNEGQRIVLATPNGLPGIPVTSGGNYTDADGQQWICDEIDLARGVYVRRIGSEKLDGSTDEVWNTETSKTNTSLFTIRINNSVNVGTIVGLDFLCTHFAVKDIYGRDIDGAQHTGKQFYFRISRSNLDTEGVSGFRAFLATSPITVAYILDTPIETPLSEEELAAYAALHTYRGNTTVLNDARAWMELEYVMDAKKYIDGVISSTILPATVE